MCDQCMDVLMTKYSAMVAGTAVEWLMAWPFLCYYTFLQDERSRDRQEGQSLAGQGVWGIPCHWTQVFSLWRSTHQR